jgi:predicted  nucleic acid-binding Zn-ribbon protein
MATALTPALKSLVETGIKVVEWLKNLDFSTVRSVASITAMTVAFTAGIAIAPRIITAISGIVTAFRTMSLAQIMVQALSGPKGWAQLAVGLAIGAGAALGVNAMFDQMADTAATAKEEVVKAGEAVKVFDASMFQAANNGVEAMKEQLAGLKDELTAAEKKYDQLRKGIEAGRNAFVGAAERGTMAEFEARFRGGQEGIIQRELQALHEMEEKELGAIRDRVRDVESAIKAKETIEVTEARI